MVCHWAGNESAEAVNIYLRSPSTNTEQAPGCAACTKRTLLEETYPSVYRNSRLVCHSLHSHDRPGIQTHCNRSISVWYCLIIVTCSIGVIDHNRWYHFPATVITQLQTRFSLRMWGNLQAESTTQSYTLRKTLTVFENMTNRNQYWKAVIHCLQRVL